MEIARYTFEQRELGAISRLKCKALGGATLAILRRLGSPERLSFAEDALPDIAAIMSSITLPRVVDDIMPAFDAHTVGNKHIVSARLLGVYRRHFPLAVDITYLVPELRHHHHENLMPIANVHEASITSWRDHREKINFPNPEELTGDFAVDIAVKALKRLRKTNLPDDATWQILHDGLE